MVRTLFGDRIEPTRRTAVVAVGDAAAIAAFVAAGELRHAGTLAAGVETFLQFAVGWTVFAVAFGAYGRYALASPRVAAGLALAAWVPGTLLAQVVRVGTRPGTRFAPSFVLVSIVVGGALLVAWRWIASTRGTR